MDRQLVGVLSICLVISTIITLFIVGERSRGIELVENQFPEAVPRSKDKGTFTFHHGIVSRQDFESLSMEFFCLRKTQSNITAGVEDFTLERALEEIPKLSTLYAMARNLGFRSSVETIDVDYHGIPGTLRLVDFSPIFASFAPAGVKQCIEGGRGGFVASPSATVSFAFLFDNEGRPVSCYEGERDFFLDRDLVLADLYLRRNEDGHSYTSSRIVQQPEGHGMTDAPKGHLLFERVRRDDRFEVGFSVNSPWLPSSLRVVQVLHVVGNLDDHLFQANFIGR